MPGPTTRVLAVLELLQTLGRVSGSELAERLAIDVRTLRRYIATLETMGIPITAERGRFGGYALVAGYKLPPLMFSDDEVVALSLGLVAARGLGLADAAPAVASVQAKLERVTPAALAARVRAIGETVTIDRAPLSTASPHDTDDARTDGIALALLSDAAQRRQRVRLLYGARDEAETRRDFDAYGIAWVGGHWYTAGYCHLRQALRTFRLDRIRRVDKLAQSFGRPDDFDARAFLIGKIATLPRQHAIEVALRTTLPVARRAVFAVLGALEATPEGVRLFAQTDDLDWFARELARLPFGFRVVLPDALREAVHRHAERLLDDSTDERQFSPRSCF
jgi:predicted DNA-binding transcriptional regulator YafY